MLLPQFKLEEYFAKYEFVAPFMMGSSDPETHTLTELVSMADEECLSLWNNLKFTYPETHGLPLLREEIRKIYNTQDKDNILVFAGADEEGVIILPGTLFDNSNNHFRLGFGRRNLPEALSRLERFTKKIIS